MQIKTLTTVITVIVMFLALSILGWIKNANLKKVIKQKAILETQFLELQKQKDALSFDLKVKQAENDILKKEKLTLLSEIDSLELLKEKSIKYYENKIAELKKLPIDTVYKFIYAYYPVLESEIPKYPFTESQVRGIHENIFKNQYLNERLNLVDESMKKCKESNVANDKIIQNLEEQNKDLIIKNDLSEDQIINLQDQLKLSNKQSGKQKRKTFLYKTTTVIAGTLAVIFAIN